MVKVNCWQFKECGRQPSGEKADELGVCPAAIEGAADGINSEDAPVWLWQAPCAEERFKELLQQNLQTVCSANFTNLFFRKKERILCNPEKFWNV